MHVIFKVMIFPTYQARNNEMLTKDRHVLMIHTVKALLNTIDSLSLLFDSWFGAYDGIDIYLSAYNTVQYACNFLGNDLPHLPGCK